MERRRIIGIVLLALAGVIFLVSNVWFLIKMPMGGEKIADLLTRTLPELLALLAVVYTFVRPGKSLKLKLDIRERRLKMDEHYAIDSFGYGYIMMGAISVAITIAFAIDILGALSVPPFDKASAGWCIIVISAITVMMVIWMSIRIVKAERHAKNS